MAIFNKMDIIINRYKNVSHVNLSTKLSRCYR